MAHATELVNGKNRAHKNILYIVCALAICLAVANPETEGSIVLTILVKNGINTIKISAPTAFINVWAKAT